MTTWVRAAHSIVGKAVRVHSVCALGSTQFLSVAA
jgi:hypothetical protein